jgi:hypothetical protein
MIMCDVHSVNTDISLKLTGARARLSTVYVLRYGCAYDLGPYIHGISLSNRASLALMQSTGGS